MHILDLVVHREGNSDRNTQTRGGREREGEREAGGGAAEELEETDGGRYDLFHCTHLQNSHDYGLERWLSG